MDMQDIIRQAEANIRQAVRDYGEHTYQTDVLDDISDEFIERLAEDSSYAKQKLRELFSKSPVWHPELDALIINGTRTHDTDYQRVDYLAHQILSRVKLEARDDPERMDLIVKAIEFFSKPNSFAAQEKGIAALNKLAPKAYKPGKKLSRVFKALCVELGVSDETAGSEFQHLYAQFADELSSRKIGFKLFVSINPAHFLTMSNPKNDRRGPCLTSCHSLNSTEYEYNCGCTGYARDEVSFIVFTVADPEDEETLNNRKTTRQVFAYKPGNGILLQSRMYNTAGGTNGAVEDSKLYRDLIQREISALEGQPNLWKVYGSTESSGRRWVRQGDGFGGYPDWVYENYDGKVCIRFDHLENGEPVNCMPLEIGTWGLCVECGEETEDGMYCDDCRPSRGSYCDDCDEFITDEDDLYTVYDEDGQTRTVCYHCRENNYTCCDHCGEYHADRVMSEVDGQDVCPDCLERLYECCEECGEYHLVDEMSDATDYRGAATRVCEDCANSYYERCDHCGCLVHEDLMCDAHNDSGEPIRVCDDCYDEHYSQSEEDEEHICYRVCGHCGCLVLEDQMHEVQGESGEPMLVCEKCYDEHFSQGENDDGESTAELKEAV